MPFTIFLVIEAQKNAAGGLKMHQRWAQCKNRFSALPFWGLGADAGRCVLTNYLIANCLCVLLPAIWPGVKHINT